MALPSSYLLVDILSLARNAERAEQILMAGLPILVIVRQAGVCLVFEEEESKNSNTKP